MRKVMWAILILTAFSFGKMIVGESQYTFGESETILQAKDVCKQLAIRNGVEAFATYIESESTIKDFVTERDVIVSRSLGMVRDVKILEEKVDKANSCVYYKIQGEINEEEVMESLKKKNSEAGAKDIKASGEYFYGESSNKIERKADDEALEKLIESIAGEKKNNFSDILGVDEDLFDLTMANMNTYRSNFGEACKKKNEGEKVIRYIKKNELSELFNARLKKINDYIDMAIEKEGSANIGSAIKYYYWALSLLRSHPDHNKLTSDKFGGKLMILSLTDKIASLFNGITFDVTDIKESSGNKTVYFLALYKGVEVQDLDYKYFHGTDQSMLQPVRNGRGSCEFYGESAKNLRSIRFDIEYRYEIESGRDKELQRVIEGVAGQYFQSSRINLDIYAKPPKVDPAKSPIVKVDNFKPDGGSFQSLECEADDADRKSYEKINLNETQISKCNSVVAEIVKAIEIKDFKGIEKYFTAEGLTTFNSIIKYGNAELMTNTFELKAGELNGEIVVRSIPMKFTFKNNKQATMEDVIFTFDKDLKIDHLSFGLSSTAIKDIMSKEDSFATLAEKLQLLQFMEYYKTAYCLKQLDYINSIFAENALIIVGKILSNDPKPIGDMYNKLGSEKVRYNKLSKNEYMEQLKVVFKSNEFINIQLENNEIRKVGGKDRVYGIQIKQNYFSANYADEGYLFLMMDLNDPKKPRIYVRSWQPEKNEDGSIIGLSDFTF